MNNCKCSNKSQLRKYQCLSKIYKRLYSNNYVDMELRQFAHEKYQTYSEKYFELFGSIHSDNIKQLIPSLRYHFKHVFRRSPTLFKILNNDAQ